MEIIGDLIYIPLIVSILGLMLALYSRRSESIKTIANGPTDLGGDDPIIIVDDINNEVKKVCGDHATRSTIYGIASKFGIAYIFDGGAQEKKLYLACKAKYKKACPLVFIDEQNKIVQWNVMS